MFENLQILGSPWTKWAPHSAHNLGIVWDGWPQDTVWPQHTYIKPPEATVDRLNRNCIVSDPKWPENDAHICTYGDYIGPKLGIAHCLRVATPMSPWTWIPQCSQSSPSMTSGNQPWPVGKISQFRWFSHWKLHRAMAGCAGSGGQDGFAVCPISQDLVPSFKHGPAAQSLNLEPGLGPCMTGDVKWMLYFMENPYL